MREFFDYFFGKGDEIEFRDFTPAHFLPILTAVGIIFLIWLLRDKIRNYKNEKSFRYALAFALIICEMSYYWRLVGIPALKPNPIDHLPITVCGWAVIFASYMLIGKSETLFSISYFWSLCGSVFALITPTVITYTGPTRFRYYQFWGEHLLGFIAVFYMIFVHKMRPTVKNGLKAYGLLGILAGIAYFANRILGPGANYLFMARPEDTPSILDILPPNFLLRLGVMTGAITLLFVLTYLPWFLMDQKAKKQKKTIDTPEKV